MSLLTRHLTDAHREVLSKRVTSNGMRLQDVICSGLRYPGSSIGVYAPDCQSYDVFRELFDPILEHFQAPCLPDNSSLACLNPAAIVSTRIRIARNLAGHVFPAGMSRPQRLKVEEKISRACHGLATHFQGTVTSLRDVPAAQLDTMVDNGTAFGPQDPYMAAAGIHADWPAGRSVFNGHDQRLSVWINEEDHLRVAVVMPGACVSACYQVMVSVMSILSAQLDFSENAQRGFLTSCPSNVGTGMRASYRVNLHMDATQEPLLDQLKSAGIIQVRARAGEHAQRTGGLVDVSFRHRVGISESNMLRDMAIHR